MSNFLLKEIIGEIVSPLTHILNLSITNSIVPNKMKIAKVIPIYKKRNAQEVGNYRPISLLTSFCKILEKLIYSRTMTLLTSIFYQVHKLCLDINTLQPTHYSSF